MSQSVEAVRAQFSAAEPVSVELIVQPAAKDPVGEMGVRVDLSAARIVARYFFIWIVEVAKVHVKGLYFPCPTGSCQPTLRTVAQRPPGVDVGMTEGMSDRERSAVGYCPADCVRSLYIYFAVGEPSGHIAKYVPIPPQVTSAQTCCAEPLDFCRVIRDRCGAYRGRGSNKGKNREPNRDSEGIDQSSAI